MNNFQGANSQFAVIAYNHLSGTDRKNLGKLYRPFIGTEAHDLYYDNVRPYVVVENEN